MNETVLGGEGGRRNESSEVGFIILKMAGLSLIPLICVFGVVGNTMAIFLIHTHHYLKKLASNRYLSALSVCSCVFLTIQFMIWLEMVAPNVNIYSTSFVGCKLITYLGACADFAGVWLIVSVCIDRVIMVYCPNQRFQLCTLVCSFRVSVGLVVLSLAVNAQILVHTSVATTNGTTGHCTVSVGLEEFHRMFTWFETLFSMLIPWFIIVVCNILVIYRLKTFQTQQNSASQVRFNLQKRPSTETTARNGTVSTGTTTPRHPMLLPRWDQLSTHSEAEEDAEMGMRVTSFMEEETEWKFIDGYEPPSPPSSTPSTPHLPPHTPHTPLPNNYGETVFATHTHTSTHTSNVKFGLRPKDIQITKSLVWVTTVFVLLNLPSYLSRLFLSDLDYSLPKMYATTLCYLLYYAHHAAVFYIYIFNTPQMRKLLAPTALKLLECYCLKPVPDFGHRN